MISNWLKCQNITINIKKKKTLTLFKSKKMKFSHKIVAASSVLLLATVALLSGSQYFKVRDEIRSMVSDSVDEIVDGVSKTTAEVINGRKSIAQYATSLIENNPEPDNVRTIISQPLIKNTILIEGYL